MNSRHNESQVGPRNNNMVCSVPSFTPPLFFAQDVHTIEMLLDNGADIGVYNHLGESILHASLRKDYSVMEYLIQRGADVNAKETLQGLAPLHYLVSTWSSGENQYARPMDKLRLLLNKGARIDAQARDGRSPLMTACLACNSFEVIRELINRGSNIQTSDEDGQTSLSMAFQSGCEEKVDLLISCGADIFARNLHTGSTTLMAACNFSKDERVVNSLLNAGATVQINMQDVHGRTALMYVVRRAYSGENRPVRYGRCPSLSFTKSLVEQHKANHDTRDSTGKTAYEYACESICNADQFGGCYQANIIELERVVEYLSDLL